MSYHKHQSVQLPDEFREAIGNTIDLQLDTNSPTPLIKKTHPKHLMLRGFPMLVEAAHRFTPSGKTPSFCETLFQDKKFSLSLVGIHRFAPLPVQDHSDTDGALLVVHGRVRIMNYQVKEYVRKPSFVRLQSSRNFPPIFNPQEELS